MVLKKPTPALVNNLEIIHVDAFIKSIHESSPYKRRLVNVILYLLNIDVSYTVPFPTLYNDSPRDVLMHVKAVDKSIRSMRMYRKLKRKLYKQACARLNNASDDRVWEEAINILISNSKNIIKSVLKKRKVSDIDIDRIISLYRRIQAHEWRKQQTRRT